MLSTLRWIALAVLPALVLAVIVWKSDRRREPAWLVTLTYALGMVGAAGAIFLQERAAQLLGLDIRAAVAGDQGALIFLLFIVAPVRELAKVVACWPAFRSRHFDEPYDGIVYSSAAALGFASVQSGWSLHANPAGTVWVVRALFALPANVFFSWLWGYALGRAKQNKRTGGILLGAFATATLLQGYFTHLTYGRGPNALFAAGALLVPTALLAGWALRDLRVRGERASRTTGSRLSRVSLSPSGSGPPSLRAVREALRKQDQPIMVRWIVVGAFVTLGSMIVGLIAAVLLGRWLNVDFSIVDEQGVTPFPVSLLAAGLLAAFPASGFLVARASGVTTLLEPALAAALALLITVVALGVAAPIAVIFALACAPLAWLAACAGAWLGRAA